MQWVDQFANNNGFRETIIQLPLHYRGKGHSTNMFIFLCISIQQFQNWRIEWLNTNQLRTLIINIYPLSLCNLISAFNHKSGCRFNAPCWLVRRNLAIPRRYEMSVVINARPKSYTSVYYCSNRKIIVSIQDNWYKNHCRPSLRVMGYFPLFLSLCLPIYRLSPPIVFRCLPI